MKREKILFIAAFSLLFSMFVLSEAYARIPNPRPPVDVDNEDDLEVSGKCEKKRADIVYIMDRSGSMSGLEKDVVGGYNSFIEEQKSIDKDVRVTAVLFDHDYKVVYQNESLDAAKLRNDQYKVGGSTALLDAVGRSIVEQSYKMKELGDKKPCKVVFVIMTDGEENSSKKYDNARLKRMVSAKIESGWEFLFFGANIDSFATGGSMGIRNNYDFKADTEGLKEMNRAAGRAAKKAIE